MNFRKYLFDETFLVSVWPHILGCITQGIATLILLLGLWVLSDSPSSFLNVLQSQIGRIIAWSIFLIILVNIALSLMEASAIKFYLLSPPVTGKALGQIRIENRSAA